DTLADDQDFEVADFNRGLVIPAFNRAVCGELTKYLDPHHNPSLLKQMPNIHSPTIPPTPPTTIPIYSRKF
ncbi:hypothetical protein NRB53_08930, partial [Klebsiella pneumoniae]